MKSFLSVELNMDDQQQVTEFREHWESLFKGQKAKITVETIEPPKSKEAGFKSKSEEEKQCK